MQESEIRLGMTVWFLHHSKEVWAGVVGGTYLGDQKTCWVSISTGGNIFHRLMADVYPGPMLAKIALNEREKHRNANHKVLRQDARKARRK